MSSGPHLGAVLVTGATGAVGRPLVNALLTCGTSRVYALTHVDVMRADDPRVIVIRGDVTAGATLGIAAADAGALHEEVTAIIHAAADTRFGAPIDGSRRVNVEGTRNVLAFAARCPRLARMIALSTAHVAGRRTGVVFEADLAHDAGFVNAYETAKHEAERELRARAVDLPIAVCRLSTVIGDSQSGAIGRRAAVHQAVRLMYAGLVPMIPGGEDSPVDLIALDYAVNGIAALATSSAVENGLTYHLCAGSDAIAAGELLDLTMQTFESWRPSWRRRAIARPALVDVATFELFRRSVDQIGDASLRATTNAVSHFAPQLAYPKRFDDRHAARVLDAAGVRRPPARETWRQVVRHLIAPAADHAESIAGGQA